MLTGADNLSTAQAETYAMLLNMGFEGSNAVSAARIFGSDVSAAVNYLTSEPPPSSAFYQPQASTYSNNNSYGNNNNQSQNGGYPNGGYPNGGYPNGQYSNYPQQQINPYPNRQQNFYLNDDAPPPELPFTTHPQPTLKNMSNKFRQSLVIYACYN